MDPTSHISPVRLFYYFLHAMPLSSDDRAHLETCAECQSMLEEWEKYKAV